MAQSAPPYEKILFKYHSSVLDQVVNETMWAEVVDKTKGLYQLDSIPFYGPLIATGDKFYAEYDPDEQMLMYRETITSSGNSIVLVVILQEGYDKEPIRECFSALGCVSEGLDDQYFAMEVLRDIHFADIQKVLEAYEQEGVLDYSIPCMSTKHGKESLGTT